MRESLWVPIAGLLATAAVVAAMVLDAGVEERADFVFDINQEPETIDTAFITGQPGGRVVNCLFEGLTQRHPLTLEPIPAVASRWEISTDGRVYTFHLRPCRWSNGEPVRADDFAFQWERVLNPANAGRYAAILYPILNAERYNRGEIDDFGLVGVEAADDSTLVVTLAHPTAYFLDLCAFYPFFPTHRATVERFGDDWIRTPNIVSNGPFVLEEWRLRRGLRMRRNPEYWDADHVALETIEAITIEHATTGFNLYVSGHSDWVDSGSLPLFVMDEIRQRSDFHAAAYLNTYFYRINVTRPPFDDKRVRQALNLATDKQAIVDYVTRGGQVPARHLVPPGMPGYQSPLCGDYDPERARALLAEAGYAGGRGLPRFELLFNTSEGHKHIAEVIQQQWKQNLGIECELINQEWKVFLNTCRSLEYDVSRGGWIGDYLDPSTFLDIFQPRTGNNRTGWDHPPYTELIRRAAAEVDAAARLDLLRQAEAILMEELPIIPIYFYVVLNCFDPRWGGCEPNLLNIIYPKYVYRKGIDRPHPVLAHDRAGD
jgi:oligopeptide transport system substrate-binding protein